MNWLPQTRCSRFWSLPYSLVAFPKLWVMSVAQSSKATEELQLGASQQSSLLMGYVCDAAQKPAAQLSWAPAHPWWVPVISCLGPRWELLPEGRTVTGPSSAVLQHYRRRPGMKCPLRQPENQHRCSSPACHQGSPKTPTHSVVSVQPSIQTPVFPAQLAAPCVPAFPKQSAKLWWRGLTKLMPDASSPPSQWGQVDEIAILWCLTAGGSISTWYLKYMWW